MRLTIAALLLSPLALQSQAAAQSPATPPAARSEPLPPLPAPRFIKPSDIDLKAVLPPFPAAGSLASQADVETMLAIQRRRTREEAADAQADSTTTMTDWTKKLLGPNVDPAKLPKLFAFVAALHDDMRGINRDANAAQGFRARPAVFDARIKPSNDLVGHGSASYPSARASSGQVWADVIARILPRRAAEAQAEAERIAWRRVVGGVHYPSDLAGSRRVAAAVGAWLARDANTARALAEIAEELRAAKVD